MKTTRQKLAKVLLRSLAEVVLIFIGVTIAFWFDSWKQEREQRAFEKEILTDLRQDLEQTIISWDAHIYYDKQRIRYVNDLIRSVEVGQLPDSLSLKMNYIGEADPYYPLFTSYETLKSKGFDLVQDSHLRTMISFLFSDTYDGWLKSVNASELEFQSEFVAFTLRWFVLGEGDVLLTRDVFMPSSGNQPTSHEFHATTFKFADFNKFVSSIDARNTLERKRQMSNKMNSVVSVVYQRTKSVIAALKEKGY